MPNQRRLFLCRLGFVVFCVLPTLLVGGWIVCRSAFSAAEKDEWQREMAARLGLIVEIADVRYPSPAVAELVEVRLLDPETHLPVAAAGRIELMPTDDGWAAHIAGLAVEGERLDVLARALRQHVLRLPANRTGEETPLSITLELGDVVLHQHGRQQSLSSCAATLQLSPDSANVELEFALPGSERARLGVCRNRAAAGLETIWQLDTGGTPLPCSLLADAWPGLSRLGRNGRFAGSLQVVDTAEGTSGSLAGTLDLVDLDALVSETFPHRLSGLATVRFDRAVLRSGKLTELQGAIHAEGGAISRSLIDAAQEHLGLSRAADNRALHAGSDLPFQLLAADFQLTDKSLEIANRGSETPGVLVANEHGPLLEAPPGHRVAAVGLIRALLPGNEHQVPATRQTEALVGLLPVPDVLRPDAESASSHTPTRLSPALPARTPAARQPVLR
jgi:hypothetical protein